LFILVIRSYNSSDRKFLKNNVLRGYIVAYETQKFRPFCLFGYWSIANRSFD